VKIVHPIKHRQKYRPWMNWVGVAVPWIDGLVIGVPIIAATTGFDRQNNVCRALVNFASPSAQQVGWSIHGISGFDNLSVAVCSSLVPIGCYLTTEVSDEIDAAHRFGFAANIITPSELFDNVVRDLFNKI